ncbi:MAG: DUF934 domain-containing protein [Pseudomonadota bacterium]
MALIKDGKEIDDPARFVPDEEALSPGVPAIISLERFQALAPGELQAAAIAGVRLMPGDDPANLAEGLGALRLVEISFPKYVDGRGFSQAQLLRRRMGYSGELRAVGEVLRDQLLYMLRSGFDAFETQRADIAEYLAATGEFSAFYQPAADGAPTVFSARSAR